MDALRDAVERYQRAALDLLDAQGDLEEFEAQLKSLGLFEAERALIRSDEQ